MDADYLKKNVNDALTEALASMAVGMPDDKVEYMGRYLKAYCQRQRVKAKNSEEAGDAESKWAANEVANNEKNAAAKAKQDEAIARSEKLTDFLVGLETSASSKQDAMDQVSEFTAEYMGVPACYIGTRKMINEVDTLYYYSANGSQQSKVVGRKLVAPAGDEGDDAPQRQGVTFEAFKAPEVPEVEPPEDAPEDWAPPPPPGPQPFVVDSCMRDTRVQFFGIPKLGSFLAIPLIYTSSDHVEGIIESEAPVEEAPEPAEGEEAPEPTEGEAAPPTEPKKIYLPQKTVSQSLVLCLDTIGKYKPFKKNDIEIVNTIGEKLINVFEALETRQFEGQSTYLENAKEFGPDKIIELMAPIAEAEAAAIAAVNEELNPPQPEPAEGEEPAPTPVVAETLKALKEAQAILNVNTEIMTGDDLGALITGLSSHVLPPVASVTNLIYTTSLLTGTSNSSKDIYGEITWNNLIQNCITTIVDSMKLFSSDDVDATDAKAFIEANGVLPGEYPPSCAVCTALAQWVTKAITACDASSAHKAYIAEQEAAASAVVDEE
jgi:hypothetical protein